MRKILVFGNSNSVFVKDFIKQYTERGFIVDLLSYGDSPKIPNVRNQLNYSASSKNPLIRQIELYKSIFRKIELVDSYYDAIVIHYVHFYLAAHILKLKKISNNIISVVWGSDFYKVNSKTKGYCQNHIFKNSNSIVFTNPLTSIEFKRQKEGLDFDKIKIARFGLPVLGEIDNLLKSPSYNKWCAQFRVPDDKVKVVVGYNSSIEHQQLFVIDQVSKLQERIIEKIHLVFPLGYGNPSSVTQIRQKLNNAKITNYTILEDFYNFHEVAKLRLISDILINIQPSDQFSGSMQETLYAGNSIIAGSWLPYDDAIKNGASIHTIDKTHDLGKMITSLVDHICTIPEDNLSQIKNYIKEKSSWESNLIIWDSILFIGETPDKTIT